jgi:hypothetical protein
VYILFVRPKKSIAFYARIYREKGYKVFELPYKLFQAPIYVEWDQSFKDKNDSFYNHHEYYKYDVIVSNTLNRSFLLIMNPLMIQEMLGPQNVPKLSKFFDFFETYH